ncbi:hypothetical protein VC83_03800 [Pseudogymnoascus destructans]|uniref:Disintegrin and metalloproteinase domain-containing protein B n=2 Tax=Pseudogymnoascus destructans TaxID=655981 RepID=L8FWB5_PSED2|nr:uncharacterized protein VC83_03800 [Pseudogymnoascus destructans]ELR05157.1 hypothetical protein GMDG_07199 [Pseudogymnoascus destructans 20631-21]OAF59583.1 hypothetical protein VC83_03800 [Pseudogymnoascus destructans]
MRLLRCVAAALVSAGFSHIAQAHSVKRAPLSYLSIVDEPVIHTPSHRVHAYSSFDLSFHLHARQQYIKLTLDPNDDVIVEGATVNYIGADGQVREVELIERSDHRVFKGHAWVRTHEDTQWTHAGWARVVIHRDGVDPLFEGAFRIDGNHHHIHPRNSYVATKHELDPYVEDDREDIMVVWRDSDITPDESNRGELKRDVNTGSCLSDDLIFNLMPEHPVYNQVYSQSPVLRRGESYWGSISSGSIFGRDIDPTGNLPGNGAAVNLMNSIGNPAGCPTSRKVALVGIATDCTYTKFFNSSSSVRANIITQMNSASVLYEESFNISLGIQNLTITDGTCPGVSQVNTPWNRDCNSGLQIQDRLNLFSAWRGASQDTNAYWTLLTTCGTGSAVGLSWLGQACVNTAQPSTQGGSNDTVSGANVVVKTDTEWLVIAHEVGHTFGAVHDCDSTTCADGKTVAAQQCCPLSKNSCSAGGKYVMNPSTGVGITNFSPCSIGNICSAIGGQSVKTNCLTSNRNVPTITGSQCGNGIVEMGEDCDCGGATGCGDNPCCNPTTCKFKTQNNAVCDPSNEDCCLSTCQFATQGTICRASTSDCDPQETCSGTAASCPADTHADEGSSCGASGDGLTCASGQCTSRDKQCKTLMGPQYYQCSDDGCQLFCATDASQYYCEGLTQNFLDGTKCGGGGKCSNGACKGSTVGGRIKEWVDQHKPLVIGLSASVGGLLLLAIISCIFSSCKRRSRQRKYAPNAPPPPRGRAGWAPQGQGRGYAVVPTPRMQQRGMGGMGMGAPPPQYEYGAGGQQYDGQWNVPQRAYGGAPVRYA